MTHKAVNMQAEIRKAAREDFAAGVKSMRELHELVAIDRARWNELGELWNELTNAEQDELLTLARGFVKAAS